MANQHPQTSTRLTTWTAAFAAFAATCCLLVPITGQALEVGGVKLEDTAKVGGKELRLNGAGVRTRAVFKVYAMGLYLGKKETTTEAVLAAAGPRRITIVMLREVSGDDFGQAFMSGINANTDKAEKAKIVGQMVKFGELFAGVPALKKGDVVTTDWQSDKNVTTIEINGKAVTDPIPDVTFYNALLKIWLGEKPADGALKPLLLGGAAS
jgi:Chalcone isomerase-like